MLQHILYINHFLPQSWSINHNSGMCASVSMAHGLVKDGHASLVLCVCANMWLMCVLISGVVMVLLFSSSSGVLPG